MNSYQLCNSIKGNPSVKTPIFFWMFPSPEMKYLSRYLSWLDVGRYLVEFLLTKNQYYN